ncbi:hypothetical protein [Kribbella jiaozuonensis]|uniref:Uncharacterized protein n=1 Tax=Kribbella jiaozuonensis TaxID=2575441 RepID=A0A4V5UZJ3_9ACTN|nr:hypothetical protein [Kribbella jiaozuonensis]TKK83103.1 hypothetical protein FDA38_10340 [Kribbella jiaozuonensis]
MGTETTVEYRLPVTKVRLQATVTETVDTIVTEKAPDGTTRQAKSRTAERSFTLVTVADPTPCLQVKVESGLMRDYAFEVGLTDDGRLTSTSIETTGHLGQVLTAGATIAGTALALATGNVPLAALLGAAGANAAVEEPLGDGGDDVPADEEPADEEPLSPEQQVWQAYLAAFPEQATRQTELTEEQQTLVGALDAARRRLRLAVPDPAKMKTEREAVATLARLKADNERELDRANQLFAAWRSGTLTETKIVYDELVDLASLPTWYAGVLTFGTDAEGKRVETFFENALGVAALVTENGTATPTSTTPTFKTDRFYYRTPRRVQIGHAVGTAQKSALISSERVLVMDRAGELVDVPVRKSLSGKRSTGITTSELGAITKINYGGTASADAGLQALAGVPAAFGGAYETVSKALTAPQQRELDNLKRAVEVEEQRLKLAGQSATATDYAELARLKQEAEIAELRAKLRQQGG